MSKLLDHGKKLSNITSDCVTPNKSVEGTRRTAPLTLSVVREEMKIETRIRIAAGLALATVLWTILPDWRSHVFFLRGLGGFAETAGVAVATSVALFEMVLLVHLISVVALFRHLRWAWFLALTALSVQVLLTAFSAVRFAVLPPAPPPVEPGVTVVTISLWPAYFRAGLNAVAVLILFSSGIRSHFLKTTKGSHNKPSEATP